MHRKPSVRWIMGAAVSVMLLGCDELAPASYRGEPQLSFQLRVLNNTNDSAELIVPALARVEGMNARLRAVDIGGVLPVTFQVEVYDAPSDDQLQPLHAYFAPDVSVSMEYVAAVLAPRLSHAIDLRSQAYPIHRDCWNGACDTLPGGESVDVTDDIASAATDEVPAEWKNDAGITGEYLVMYLSAPVPPHSWAALRLGAPQGLARGYHLAKRLTRNVQAQSSADDCRRTAAAEALARFNTEHNTALDENLLDCLLYPHLVCDGRGAAQQELASAFAAEEVERGCHELSPEIELVAVPARERVSVRLSKLPLELMSTVPRLRAPAMRQEGVVCPGSSVDAVAGVATKPTPSVRLKSFQGTLCPEDSLELVESDGAFSILQGTEESGVQRCELDMVVTVPPGYRFRRPLFGLHGFAYRESEAIAPSSITMAYAMGGSHLRSQHPVSGTLDGDFFTLLDTPYISTPQCNAACEPVELDLKIEVDIHTPEGAYTSLDLLEGDFEMGVEWTTCGRDFESR